MAYDGGSSVRRRRRSGGAANPLAIFGSRLKLWLDPSDISTLYQNNTLATPVSALNDPIGGIKDKSGNSNHATQGTSASRPLWKQDGNGCFNGLMDGVDDCWATAAIDLSASDLITVFAAVRKSSDAASGCIAELTVSADTTNGGAALFAPYGAATNFAFVSRGTITRAPTATPFAAPYTAVLTGAGNISGDLATIRVNGAQVGSSSSDQGTGNYANAAVYIGRRGGSTFPFNGQIYQLFIVQGTVTAAEIAAAEAYCNSKSQAY